MRTSRTSWRCWTRSPMTSSTCETPRFRLTLRRAPGAAGPRSRQVLAEPSQLDADAPNGASAARCPPAPAGRPEPVARGPGRRSDQPVRRRGGRRGRAGRRRRRRCPGRSTGRRGRGPPPFVEVGDAVARDTVVAIVETMKLMNSVHAGTRGPGRADLRRERRVRPARHHADADRARREQPARRCPAAPLPVDRIRPGYRSASCCYPARGGRRRRKALAYR